MAVQWAAVSSASAAAISSSEAATRLTRLRNARTSPAAPHIAWGAHKAMSSRRYLRFQGLNLGVSARTSHATPNIAWNSAAQRGLGLEGMAG